MIPKIRIYDSDDKAFRFEDLLNPSNDLFWISRTVENYKDRVQLFTGIIDKDGEEVYEGDFLDFSVKAATHGREREDYKSQEVYYDSECAAFMIGKNYSKSGDYYWGHSFMDEIDMKTVKVVGNIFQGVKKMKIGVIFCGFNMEEYIHDSLSPWISARESKLSGNEWVISCVSVPFKEYKDENIEEDKTRLILQEYYDAGKIDSLITEPDYSTEAIIRDRALQFLLEYRCDVIWLADADEFITEEQIKNINNHLNLNKWISWFSLSLKNYVFTESQYLEDAFTPPRIFRVNTNGYKINRCIFDNDFSYISDAGQEVSYKSLPTKIIPKFVGWITHYSWLNNSKSRSKVTYQQKHFGDCSYIWGEDGLEFNKNYYTKHGLSVPKVIHEP